MLAMLAMLAATAGPGVVVDEHEIEATGGRVLVERREDKPSLYVASDRDSFFCDGTFGAAYTRKSLTKYAEVLLAAAQTLDNGVTAKVDYDLAKGGITGTQAEGYCNMNVVLDEGQGFVTFVHNDACFGSAGCTTSVVTLLLDAAKLHAMSEAFAWGAAK